MSPVPISVSIVVPAYNEAGADWRDTPNPVRASAAAVLGLGDPRRRRRVDRCDRQHCRDVRLRRAAPRRAARTPPRQGWRRQGRPDGGELLVRFMCDADLSMPISELKSFLPPLLDDYDVAIGTREGVAARRVGEPRSRHLVGRCSTCSCSDWCCRASRTRSAASRCSRRRPCVTWCPRCYDHRRLGIRRRDAAIARANRSADRRGADRVALPERVAAVGRTGRLRMLATSWRSSRGCSAAPTDGSIREPVLGSQWPKGAHPSRQVIFLPPR